MAITVTRPVSAPTNLQASLIAGGSLAPNTTYYFVMFANSEYYTTPGYFNRHPSHSDISVEGYFTTTTTDLSVKITWDNIPEHVAGTTRYQVLLSETSGDYSESGDYESGLENVGNALLDGPTGYTITAITTLNYIHHSVQLKNQLHPEITNDLGMIFVNFHGNEQPDLDTVYSAIVSAGFSNYVRYNGYFFVIKGWFYTDSSDAGTLEIIKKSLIFLKGGVQNLSTIYIFRFGRWKNDYAGSNDIYGCNIDILGGRYGFWGYYSKRLQVYGCRVTHAFSRNDAITEVNYYLYYCGAAGLNICYNTEEIRDNIFSFYARGNNSTVKDMKWAQQNNWSNVIHIRLRIWSSPNMPYSAGLGSFYDCTWGIFSSPFSIHDFADERLNYTNMYDGIYPGYPNDMIDAPYVRFYTYSPDTDSDNYIMNHYRVQFRVLDVDGNPVEGVSVSAIDGLGNPAEWIEQDDSFDHLVTGNKYTTDRITDSNGEIFYYLKAYKNYLNPDNVTTGYTHDTLKENYYPYTINFSKNGWRPYSVLVETLKEPVIGVVTLEYGLKTYVELDLKGDVEEDVITGKI
jgi:hypothetical protein